MTSPSPRGRDEPGRPGLWTRFVPLVKTLGTYRRATMLPGDIGAGLTVGVMLIPQGMAYALIAGMPPVYGLYAALVPLVVYAFLGTSGQLAVGPVAVVSLLVAAAVGSVETAASTDYIRLVLVLSLLVGGFQLILGLAGLGSLTSLLSRPVLSGFMSAAAIVIGSTQVKHILGVSIPRGDFLQTISALWQALPSTHGPTLAMGIGGMLLMLAIRHISRRTGRKLPDAMIAVLVATLVTWLLRLDETGLLIVGTVPAGLPAPGLATASWSEIRMLAPTAIIIGLIGFIQSIAVAQSFATRSGDRIHASQELRALGVANILGSVFQAFPSTGGFARSAVNHDAGANTTLASLISAAIVALTLIFLTPLFTYLPQALLGGIILLAVVSLISWGELVRLYRTSRPDAVVLAATFLFTLFLGFVAGIGLGVVLALALFTWQASRPHTARLGRLPGTTSYRNTARYEEADEPHGLVILRIDASLFFANMDFVREEVNRALAERPATRIVLLDMYPVNRIDASALHELDVLMSDLAERGVRLAFAAVKGPVRDKMEKSALGKRIDLEELRQDLHSAVVRAEKYLAETFEDTRP